MFRGSILTLSSLPENPYNTLVTKTAAAAALTTIVAGQHTYQVVRQLGSGGMGTVLLVRRLGETAPLALKFLHAGMSSKARVDAFKREFRLLAGLHHPHVCQVFDFGYAAQQQQYFFTAEFVEGDDLYRTMLQAPLDEQECVMAQVISALEFIHGLGLIHFDVKGANVLVRRVKGLPHAKLMDFGVTSPANQIKEIAGTLNYMAPELFDAKPVLDQRADLYSLGIMFYRMLTGLYPYELSSIDGARAFHHTPTIDLEPLRSRGLPDYIVSMIARLLAKHPDERFSSASVVMNYLTLHAGKNYVDTPQHEQTQLQEGPFVGRARTLATLVNAVQRIGQFVNAEVSIAQEEHPQSYIISAPRGLGKSRLLQELKQQAQITECTTWIVHGGREGHDLFPFMTALGIAPEAVPATVDESVQLLLARAADQPTCYLIDNLDRAAPTVQQTVYGLVGRLYSATLAHDAPPLLVVIAFSPDQGKAPHAPGTPVLELAPLEQAEVAQYVQQMIGAREETKEIAQTIWNFSGGVPLLMTEAVRHLHEAGGALPTSIDDLYTQRLARLDGEELRLMELLAFAARPLPENAFNQPTAEVQRILARLHSAGLARNVGDDTHALWTTATGALTQTIVQNLDDAHKQMLADVLYHWFSGQSHIRAREYAMLAPYLRDHAIAQTLLERATQEAEQAGATEIAVRFLTDRIALLRASGSDAASISTLQRKIATLRLYQGKYAACETLLSELITEHGGDADVDDLKMLGIAKRAQRKPAEAGVLYDQALAKLAHDPSNPTYLFILNERAQAWMEEGAVEKALDTYQQTHAWTKELPPEAQRKVTNNNLGLALARLGRFDHAVEFYQEKLAALQHEKRLCASIYGQMGVLYLHAGRTDDALRAFLQSWQKSVEMGTRHNALALLENIITLLQKKASYSEALGFAQQSFELKAAGATDVEVASSLMTVATLYLNLGVADLAARYLTQGMRLARKARNHQLLGWIQITFGYLYKDLGRLMESLNAFEETIAIGETHNDESLLRWGCYGAIDLLVENGEIEEASPFITRLQPLMPKETDAEFQTRYAILLQKFAVMTTPQPDPAVALALQELSSRCAASGWGELHWEVEYLLGVYHHKRDELDAALNHLRSAYEIIMMMATGLGEEYREHFVKQRSRSRVLADLKTVSRVAAGGLSIAGTDAATNPHTIAQTTNNEGLQAEDAPKTACMADAAQKNPAMTMAQPRAEKSAGAGAPHTAVARQSFCFAPNKTLAAYERDIIKAALTHYDGNLEKVAENLGIALEELLGKMDEHGV